VVTLAFPFKWKCQGDHGRCRANYRCCLPALAGFVSPHSVGPDGGQCAALFAWLQGQSCFWFRVSCFGLRVGSDTSALAWEWAGTFEGLRGGKLRVEGTPKCGTKMEGHCSIAGRWRAGAQVEMGNGFVGIFFIFAVGFSPI